MIGDSDQRERNMQSCLFDHRPVTDPARVVTDVGETTDTQGKPVAWPASILAGFDAWQSREAYIDARGHYRLTETGRIAPWSKAVRSVFPDVARFHEACATVNEQRGQGRP